MVGFYPGVYRRFVLLRVIKGLTVSCGVLAGLVAVALLVSLFFFRDGLEAYAGTALALAEAPGYRGGLEDEEDLLSYIEEHPRDVSLVSYGVDGDGEVIPGEPEVRHLEREPMPLASTVKVTVLGAYAREVAQGDLDPDEVVTAGEWERYYRPGTDGGAHTSALEYLDISQTNGSARNPEASVTLDQLAGVMIRFSDNASTDYLLDRIGDENVRETMEEAGMERREPLIPELGTSLIELNHDHPRLTNKRTDYLLSLSDEEVAAKTGALQRAYTSADWGDEERRWQREIPLSSLRNQDRLHAGVGNKGEARDYARVMSLVAADEFISPKASKVMRRHLEWPMDSAGTRERYDALGTKGGSASGVLTVAEYAAPKGGDFAGERRVAVLFMRDLPYSAYLRLTTTTAQSRFLTRLTTDEDFARRVGEEVQFR